MTDSPLPVVLLGVAPAQNGAPAWAPDTGSGRALAKLAGVEPDRLGELFALDNLCATAYPDTALLRQCGIRYQFVPDYRYVLAGWDVVQALGTRVRPGQAQSRHYSPDVFEWYETREGVLAARLPHPSGMNRWYNSLERRGQAATFLRGCAALSGAHRAWRAARGALPKVAGPVVASGKWR